MIRMIQPSDYTCQVGIIICGFGPMFASKTTWAILQAKREVLVGKVLVFKHHSDVRYSSEEVLVTHDGENIQCIPVQSHEQIKQIVEENPGVTAVIIDECQFFDVGLVDVVVRFADKFAIRVYCVGLDLTFERKPWPTTQALMPVADEVHKLKAMCMQCKKRDAMFSKRVSDVTKLKHVSGAEDYTAVCRNCFNM
ncbi:MAG: thymidine kinase [Candidatus Magasanikbacteria bacterium]|nr:thymidine kinase [Candidatus Magasanikbacteria bacterium]